MDKRVLEMCREIDKQKLATAQDGVTAWAEKLLDENAALRGQLQKETQRRFDGNEIASKEHREEVAALREQIKWVLHELKTAADRLTDCQQTTISARDCIGRVEAAMKEEGK